MNLIPVYARCVSQLLHECRLHSFSSTNGSFKSLCSTKLITSRVPSRFSSSEEKAQLIIAKDPSRDRRIQIPEETSIRYLKSKAYTECYGNDPVWKHYRRNHKGQVPPRNTRKMCIRAGVITTGNPCPICRDEYLIVHYTNIDLIKQFISPTSGELIDPFVTGVCQKQFFNLKVAFAKAIDLGLITFDVPFRKYDYSDYHKYS